SGAAAPVLSTTGLLHLVALVRKLQASSPTTHPVGREEGLPCSLPRPAPLPPARRPRRPAGGPAGPARPASLGPAPAGQSAAAAVPAEPAPGAPAAAGRPAPGGRR